MDNEIKNVPCAKCSGPTEKIVPNPKTYPNTEHQYFECLDQNCDCITVVTSFGRVKPSQYTKSTFPY